MSRFRRGRDPRAGRRPLAVPATPPPAFPDGPRDDLVQPSADTGRHHLPALTLVHSAVEDDHGPETAPILEAGLPASRVEHLERLTASWMRQARIAGAGPDATMFYAAPPKPPPPPRLSPANNPASWSDSRAETFPVPDEQPDPATGAPVRDWASRHDPASLEFDVRDRLRASVPLQDRLWDLGPALDQGTTPPLDAHDAAGCVGFAAAAAANVLELATLPLGMRSAEAAAELLTADDARALYARAQELDQVSGHDYPGTSVLAGMLAGRAEGLWGSFLWAFGTRDIAQAVLQVGPVIIGIPWDSTLETPDADGVIVPGGSPAGGHALAVVGVLRQVAGRPGPFFVLQQSRGENYGDRGRVYLHHKHLAALLHGVGEAAIPVPRYPSGALS